jgi:DNA topoisomerase-3
VKSLTKILIIAEKPSQAQSYADGLGLKKQGLLWRGRSDILPNMDLTIIALQGHLFGLVYPEKYNPDWKKWDMNTLPMCPKEYKYELTKTKGVSAKFKIAKEEVAKCDEIIVASDYDNEGSCLVQLVLQKIPKGVSKIKYRLVPNALTKGGVQKAFKNLQTPQKSDLMYHAASARGKADWLVGMSISRMTTIALTKLGKCKFGEGSYSVGRVQTPTVQLIVENDNAIKNFVPKDFWTVALQDNAHGEVKFSNEDKFFTEEEFNSKVATLGNTATVTDVKTEQKTQTAPKLFNLTALQKYGAKQWKKSATEILDVCEKLYQAKYLSYPRTDIPFIPLEEFNEIKQEVGNYKKVLGVDWETPNMAARKQYVDDKKVKEHYALIPTHNIPDRSKLSDFEWNVYETVTKRALLMFTADHVYDLTTVTVEDNGTEFKTTGKVVKQQGFKAYSTATQKEEPILPDYAKGQSVSVTPTKKKDKTKPVARLTESSLIGTQFPKYGLGTSATRASIIDTIIKRGYVKKDKKTGEMFPLEKAFILTDFLKGTMFTDVGTTKQWENALRAVETGKIKEEKFVEEIEKQLREVVAQYK